MALWIEFAHRAFHPFDLYFSSTGPRLCRPLSDYFWNCVRHHTTFSGAFELRGYSDELGRARLLACQASSPPFPQMWGQGVLSSCWCERCVIVVITVELRVQTWEFWLPTRRCLMEEEEERKRRRSRRRRRRREWLRDDCISKEDAWRRPGIVSSSLSFTHSLSCACVCTYDYVWMFHSGWPTCTSPYISLPPSSEVWSANALDSFTVQNTILVMNKVDLIPPMLAEASLDQWQLYIILPWEEGEGEGEGEEVVYPHSP